MSRHLSTDRRRFEDLRFILRGNRRGLALLSTLSLITALCETFLLAAIVQSISAMGAGRTSLSLDLGPVSLRPSVTALLLAAMVAALVRGSLVAVVATLGPRITARSRERHRGRLFESYLAADWATQSAEKTGRLLQTISTSVSDANTIVALSTQALPALITLTVLLTVAFILNPIVTGCLVLFVLLVGIVLRPLSTQGHRASRADAAGRNAIASHVSSVLTAGAEITALGARQGVLEVGLGHVHRAETAYARAVGLKRLVSTAGQSIAFTLAAGALLVLVTSDVSVDFTTVGTITVLLLRGVGLAQQVQSASSQYGTVTPFIEQVRTLTALYTSRRQTYGSAAFPAGSDVVINDVAYAYPGTGRTVLVVDHATIRHGSSVAVVGPSGSGKSTLMQMLLRLRVPTQGTIKIGGLGIETINETAFAGSVAYVPQSPHLVPGTIADNIGFFRSDVGEEAIVRAAGLAHIHDDIIRMPDGYQTVIDSHVDALSGGQKQRLALARALVRDPAILVLDEPTSALDATNEAAVVQTLVGLRGHTTVIIVTHKMSTAAHCDYVFRIEDGRLRQPSAITTSEHDQM